VPACTPKIYLNFNISKFRVMPMNNDSGAHFVGKADDYRDKILPLRQRAEVKNRWLKHHLETILPEIMRREGRARAGASRPARCLQVVARATRRCAIWISVRRKVINRY
jgi:hypothetical protein